MSIIRNKYLKRAGLKTKSQKRKARKACKNLPKCNIKYQINNVSFYFGLNESFVIQSSKL